MKNNRRNFLKLSGLATIGFAGADIMSALGNESVSCPLGSTEPENPISIKPLNRFPCMVHEYFVEKVRQIEKKAITRRSSLRSRSDAENYIQEVREKIQQCFGPWPERTPLNAKVSGIVERGSYRIEKIIFESRPGFPVTANLYVPKGRNFPLPAVIGTCGHSANGKAGSAYQSFSQGLARMGYIVLIFDPMGQGERLQYIDDQLRPRHGYCTDEHLYVGNQMVLTGESLFSWFVWDGIRALDYLLTRSEVDPKHIGVTGNSGGGTQATWLCGVDSRFTMAAPSCFVTTFRHNLENELPADCEQYPPRALSLGLDHEDFIAAIAPKPVILLGQEKDFFDVRGIEESYKRLKRLYKLLGAEQNIQLFIGPDYHGYSQKNREAMYRWFNKITKLSDMNTEPPLILEEDKVLWCTTNGQVGKSGSNNVSFFTKKNSLELKKKRRILNDDELKQAVIDSLKLSDFQGVPYFRILRPLTNRLYPKTKSTTYLIETEPGIYIPVYRLGDNELVSRPPIEHKRAIFYVSHQSADKELREDKFLRELISKENDSVIFACDVRGIGETQPNTCDNNFLNPYGCDYFYAGHSILFDYPYVGQKTYDLLRIIAWIMSHGHKEIHLVGKGWGTIPATFAALLSKPVAQVTLINALSCYSDIAESEDYNWPLASLLPSILKTFDLPDCYRVLASKSLRHIEPWSAMADQV